MFMSLFSVFLAYGIVFYNPCFFFGRWTGICSSVHGTQLSPGKGYLLSTDPFWYYCRGGTREAPRVTITTVTSIFPHPTTNAPAQPSLDIDGRQAAPYDRTGVNKHSAQASVAGRT